MTVRFFALLALAATLAATAQAQEISSKTDRSRIKSCGTPPPEVAGMTIWTADRVGVSRLIPEMPGSDNLQIFRYFVGAQPTDILSDSEKLALQLARNGIQESTSLLFFNEAGTPLSVARKDPPADFYNDLIDAARPSNLRTEYLPCWTRLASGLTYGTRLRTRQGRTYLDVSALPGPVVVGWYEEGVYTPDGQPAVKVSVTKPVTPTEGPYQDVSVEVIVFDICGNISGRITHSEVVQVTAPPPPPPVAVLTPAPPPLRLPTPQTLPPLPPGPPPDAEITVRHHDRFWCFQDWWKAAICGSPALALIPRLGSGSVAAIANGPLQPVKGVPVAGPGPRP